jgi:hypothetical protein
MKRELSLGIAPSKICKLLAAYLKYPYLHTKLTVGSQHLFLAMANLKSVYLLSYFTPTLLSFEL